jgi:hypothetical protein
MENALVEIHLKLNKKSYSKILFIDRNGLVLEFALGAWYALMSLQTPV